MADAPKKRTKGLKTTLSALKKVFGKYRGSLDWHAARSSETSALTTEVSVDELSFEEYASFCWYAGSLTDTSEEAAAAAVRYFLPRVAAEVSTGGCAPWCEDELAFMLDVADWGSWPQPERTAIADWFTAWLNQGESDMLKGKAARPFRCDFRTAGCAGFDVTSYLIDFIEEHEGDGSVLLAGIIVDYTPELLHAGWPPGWDNYWATASAPDDVAADLIEFFLSPRALELIVKGVNTRKKSTGLELFERAKTCIGYLVDYADQLEGTPLAEAAKRVQKRDWYGKSEYPAEDE